MANKKSDNQYSGTAYFTVLYLTDGNLFLFKCGTPSECRETAKRMLADPERGPKIRYVRYSRADLGRHPDTGCWLGTERL